MPTKKKLDNGIPLVYADLFTTMLGLLQLRTLPSRFPNEQKTKPSKANWLKLLVVKHIAGNHEKQSQLRNLSYYQHATAILAPIFAKLVPIATTDLQFGKFSKAKPSKANGVKISDINAIREIRPKQSQCSYQSYYQMLTAILHKILRKLVPFALPLCCRIALDRMFCSAGPSLPTGAGDGRASFRAAARRQMPAAGS